ncbi:MAG: hydroxyglutarate oxidase [Gemmatimonadales bacterium]|jgi:L-2-hydroxyglutarate oxidase|nr:hydroxyglutarate oxidase [Gemmatimonadales bacterium]
MRQYVGHYNEFIPVERSCTLTATIGIIGGGIVGIAIARALSQTGDFDVVVFEKEERVAAHQTGHNSGVVHAGIYYPPGSLKARLCAIGRERTRDYCAEKGLPYRELGKLVVAIDESERPRLTTLEERAVANGVPGLRRVDRDELRDIEPHVAGVAGLHSPRTAVVDYTAITEALADDVREAGGTIHLGQEVTSITQRGGKVEVETADLAVAVDKLIVCAGLHSDVVAKMLGGDASPKILPFRGEYWSLAASGAHLVRGMIYPVPDPRFPFLGVHFTRGVHDDIHVGPNAVPALAREGYRWSTVSIADTFASLTWPGAPSLLRQHWRMGLKEVSGSLVKRLYFRDARRFVPELRMADLESRSAAGVRAQAWGRDGALIDDFAVDQLGEVTVLRNAPSPAATSAMAIADHVLANHVFSRT